MLSPFYTLTFLQFPSQLISIIKHILRCLIGPGLQPHAMMEKGLNSFKMTQKEGPESESSVMIFFFLLD